MTSFTPSKELTLAPYITTIPVTERKDADETIYLSGREVLLENRVHIEADISAARSILLRLQKESAYRTERQKESTYVSSVSKVTKRGGIVGA